MPEKFRVITAVSGHPTVGDANEDFDKALAKAQKEGWQVMWGTYRMAVSDVLVHSVLVFKT